jgi:hypothetical protein
LIKASFQKGYVEREMVDEPPYPGTGKKNLFLIFPLKIRPLLPTMQTTFFDIIVISNLDHCPKMCF